MMNVSGETQLDLLVYLKREASQHDHEVLASVEKMVHKMIREMVCNYGSADVGMDEDDLLQIGRMYVMEAIQQFDPSRGAKLTTFIYLKLWTKFANIGRKLKTHNKRGTLFMSQVDDSGALTEASTSDHLAGDSHNPFNPFRGVVESLMDAEDSMIERIDRQSFMEWMSDDERTLYLDHFVHGFNLKETIHRNNRLPESEVRKTLRALSQESLERVE